MRRHRGWNDGGKRADLCLVGACFYRTTQVACERSSSVHMLAKHKTRKALERPRDRHKLQPLHAVVVCILGTVDTQQDILPLSGGLRGCLLAG